MLSRFSFQYLRAYFFNCLDRACIVSYKFEKYLLTLAFISKSRYSSFCRN